MNIEWINHASFVLNYNNIRLITDPWIEGAVFNESWSLISKTKFKYSDFKRITHIWFSHEHPDHFSPPNISKIPKEFRSNITVLYQETMDEKVKKFCKKLKFKKIIELKNWNPIKINNQLELTLSKVSNDTDSWLHIKSDDFSILNLNDCVLSKKELRLIEKKFTNTTILLTQFSFASWAGNKNDSTKIKDAAKEYLKSLKVISETVRPKHIIPFASYIWFCSKENYYFNEYSNKIDKIYQYLKDIKSSPTVLYPGETWSFLDEKHDSLKSLERYKKDYKEINVNNTIKVKEIKMKDLYDSANKFIDRSLRLNSEFRLRRYKPFRIHINDYDLLFEFSFNKGLNKIYDGSKIDISFSSQNLKYCFDYMWGFDTILVAGTYQKPSSGDFQRFLEYQWVANRNNTGKKIKLINLW